MSIQIQIHIFLLSFLSVLLGMAYYRYSFVMCFSQLTMYPGNHSLSIFLIHFSQLLSTALCDWTIESLFNKHSPIYEHVSYFQYFKIINNAAINIFVQMYFWYFQH